MFKTICILTLTLTSVICIPVESSADSKGLNRPSPINPDVISDPKPKDVSTSAPKTSPDAGSHVQKIPNKGEKLSSELEQTDRKKATSAQAPSKPAFRRGQATSTSTVAPKQSVTTTHAPVSLKTPVAESSNAKVKREVESSNATTTTTTRAPVINNSQNDNDNSAPHFVRPVPVEQILKNIHDTPKHREPSQVVSLHDHETEHQTSSTSTTSSPDGGEVTKAVDDHKVHRVSLYKKKNDDNSKSSEETKSSDEDNKDQ